MGRNTEAWHREPEELYDFSSGNYKIEVKSACGRERTHHFSLDQLRPPKGSSVLIASVLVERSGGGTSLQELLDDVRNRTSPEHELAMKMEIIVSETLGSAWRNGLGDRFDVTLAAESLRYYDPLSIPSISGTLPPQVSDVRFKSDLSEIPSVDLQSFRTKGLLFQAL